MRRYPLLPLILCAAMVATMSNRGLAQPAAGPVVSTAAQANDKVQEDFPAMCLDEDGTPWVAYVEYDTKADTLKVAKKTADGMQVVGSLAGPGIIHRPSIACDATGTIWVVWSDLDENNAWSLKARAITDGVVQSDTVTLEGTSGSAVFSTAGTDGKGRVWVAWQSFRKGLGDIFAKHYDPATGRWSDEIQVTTDAAGDWEPQLAFADDAAWIALDSSRADEVYNVYLAKVSLDGKTELTQITDSIRYQGRPSIAAAPDGKGFWLAWENGRVLWGKNSRGVSGANGLNGDKRIEVAYYDIASGKVSPVADATPAIKWVPAPKPAATAKPPAAKKKGAAARVQTVNLPKIVVDANGNPWLATRRYIGVNWKIVLTKFDRAQDRWTQPVTFANSTFSQDRRCNAARDAKGRLWFAWPSDLRTTKKALISGIYVAEVDPTIPIPLAATKPAKAAAAPKLPEPRWGDDTPDRARSDHHTWSVGDEKYELYWGDFHRHTDISNCITPHDGCIVEQFRYAYDIGKLDLLGTSDHTDIGKPYDPYEWWCNQKLADVFFVPGFFTSMYVYEREQRWPWGHRNVIFAERGGPIVYIKRALYKSMPWHATLPAAEGGTEILPQELWKILGKSGMDVSIMSHTGATGMGTDWDGYDEIDNAVENLVEIYQGARVSYEGIGAPQPTVGFPRNRKLKPDAHGSVQTGRDFGQFNKGVYQQALKNGYKLGVFANSDHISTHTSFGGVYVKSFTRHGILEGLNARRTIAGTDKIFIDFSCNGHPMGEVFETTDKPELKVSVEGTAMLKAVTILRNEVNIRRFTPENTKQFETTFTDDAPIDGENRYYVRVEQVDGSIGWASPVWVTVEGK